MRNKERHYAHQGFIRAYPSLDAMVGGFSSTTMPVVVSDARDRDLPIIFVNAAFEKLTGYSAEEVIGRNCRFLQGKRTDPESVAEIRRAILSGDPISIDILNYRKDGTEFWNALSLAPVRGEDGAPEYYFSCQLDARDRLTALDALHGKTNALEGDNAAKTAELELSVMAQKKMNQEKTLLIHEMHHRVRNNLQMISALIALELHQTSDTNVKSTLSSLQDRVEALSAVQRRLHQPASPSTFDVAGFLSDHALDIVSTYGEGDIAVSLDARPIDLSSRVAGSVALVLNELITRALKDIPPASRGGRLLITAKIRDQFASVAIKAMHPKITASLPLALDATSGRLVRALIHQLRATLTFPQEAGSSCVELQIPLEA